MIRCTSCGSENPDNSTYCIRCGSKIISSQNTESASTVECPHCRQLNPGNNIFCGNCGENMKIGAANQTTQVSADAQKWTGIGGWLTLPVIGIFLTILMGFIAIVLDMYQRDVVKNAQTFQYLLPPLYFEMFMNLTFAILSIFALVLLFEKKKVLPKFMVGFYILSCIFLSIDITWITSVTESAASATVAAGVFRIIATVIWIPYFLKSKRVKNTFVN